MTTSSDQDVHAATKASEPGLGLPFASSDPPEPLKTEAARLAR
jgi:hypothetical protein